MTAGSDLTDQLFTRCLSYLEHEEAYQAQLLETLQTIRQCLVQGDLARLQAVTRERLDLRRVGREMERERRELLAEAAVALRLPGPHGLTIGQIAQAYRGERRRILLERAAALRQLLERIRHTNEGNALLLRHHLELLRRVLHTLVGEPTAGTLYRPSGEVDAPCDGAIVRTVG